MLDRSAPDHSRVMVVVDDDEQRVQFADLEHAREDRGGADLDPAVDRVQLGREVGHDAQSSDVAEPEVGEVDRDRPRSALGERTQRPAERGNAQCIELAVW